MLLQGNVSRGVGVGDDDDSRARLQLLAESSEWRSSPQADAGFFTPESRPGAVRALYDGCEAAPRLKELQVYRQDSLDCQKLYSDPEMFFAIWKNGMLDAAKKTRLQRKQTRRRRFVLVVV